MHRRHDQEAAVAGGDERVPGGLREQERASEQQRDERVEAVLREVADGRDVLEAGVRDHGVEPAVEALERRVDDGAVALARRQVGVVDVDGVHGPAVGGQALGDGGADAAPGTGHQAAAAHVLTYAPGAGGPSGRAGGAVRAPARSPAQATQSSHQEPAVSVASASHASGSGGSESFVR